MLLYLQFVAKILLLWTPRQTIEFLLLCDTLAFLTFGLSNFILFSILNTMLHNNMNFHYIQKIQDQINFNSSKNYSICVQATIYSEFLPLSFLYKYLSTTFESHWLESAGTTKSTDSPNVSIMQTQARIWIKNNVYRREVQWIFHRRCHRGTSLVHRSATSISA